MSLIRENLDRVRETIPSHVTLVAVSKTKPNEAVMEAYQGDQRVFGENKVQELVDKAQQLPKDIEWHFIGHLQTNKVKYIAPFVSMIHAVDSFKLLKAINKEGQKHNRRINVLLQVHIADEESKFGFPLEEIRSFLKEEARQELPNVQICGLMGMATFTDDMEQVRKEFQTLATLFKELKTSCFKDADYFCQLSMGMSGDYPIAIEEGATLVRIGSTIFGQRNYAL